LILREASIEAPILVLGRVPARFADLAAENDIILTFYQKEWLEELNQYPLKNELKLHMKWDTGMGRIGITSEEKMDEVINDLNDTPKRSVTGLYTHFANADYEDLDYFHQQKECFEKMLDNVQEK